MVKLHLNSSVCLIAHLSCFSDAWGSFLLLLWGKHLKSWVRGWGEPQHWASSFHRDTSPTLLHSLAVTQCCGLPLQRTGLVDAVRWPITDESSKPCVADGIAEAEKAHRTVLQMHAVQVGLQWIGSLEPPCAQWVGWEASCEWSKFEYWGGILGKDILISVPFNIYHGSQPRISCWHWRGAQHDLE